MKLMKLIRKQMPSPQVARITPATAGPIKRARVTIEEFKAIPFWRSSFEGTNTIISACLEGASKALIIPRQTLKKIITGTL